MKILVFKAALFLMSLPVQAATLAIDCVAVDSTSTVQVQIYSADDRVLAKLVQKSGDNDSIEDVFEITRREDGCDCGVVTWQQALIDPTIDATISESATHLTKNAELNFRRDNQLSISADSGPDGQALQEQQLKCKYIP